MPRENPPSLDQLISALRVLPGVGPKSAQRMAYHLLQRDKPGAEKLARAGTCAQPHRPLPTLQHLQRNPLCALCADPARRQDQLCGGMPADMLTWSTQSYDGLYFVLMGRLSPLDGVGPRDLPLEKLAIARWMARCAR